MKINTMRKIDRWVGVPICFFLSPFCWFSDLVRGAKRKSPNLQRTLFIELSEMGSAVIADPAMRKLKEKGGAELYFVIFRKNVKSLEILNTVPNENIFRMNGENFWGLVIDIFRFMGWCRRKKISTVTDLELFSRFTAILSFLSGARTRIGFTSLYDEGLYRGNLVNRTVRYNPHVHIAVNFISLVNRGLGLFDNAYATLPVHPEELKLTTAEPPLASVEEVRSKIRKLYPSWKNEPLVLLNANASDLLPQRRWPPQHFAALGKLLLEKFPHIIIIMTGAPAENNYVEDITIQIADPRCVNSAGLFSFDELVPLYSISTCMLTNDSGPAHFASVTSLKVFVIFGPETPHLYLPLGNAEAIYLGLACSPCVSAANHRKTTCVIRPCVTEISTGYVFDKMSFFLQKRQAASLIQA
jgi:ADP-heptose:LPS heptosyltransferase